MTHISCELSVYLIANLVSKLIRHQSFLESASEPPSMIILEVQFKVRRLVKTKSVNVRHINIFHIGHQIPVAIFCEVQTMVYGIRNR